ncbi:MAG: antitoxin Xre/MbcA/ParS toxin-binding domain-containing protein, partial [Bryobacteraceae bacterium]
MATSKFIARQSAMQMLGRQRVSGGGKAAPRDLMERVRAGLPYSALESLMRTLSLTREEASASLSVPARTLARRKREHKLSAEESDRLFRLARVAARATEVLGKTESAAKWLRAPNRALGGAAPLSVLDTDPGAQEVEQILGRIEWGVFS